MEYLSTKQVAEYLHLNEKKVYALVSAGEMPASRVCGKWLFPKHLIDQWVEGHTTVPGSYKVDGLLDDLLVVQGSDDGMFESACREFRHKIGLPVVEAHVGSLPGLQALSQNKAHMAGCHVANQEVARQAKGGRYLVSLFHRQQGLMFQPDVLGKVNDLSVLARKGLRFADRQPGSGTYALTRALMQKAQVGPETMHIQGPYHTHLEVALAVRCGSADLGVGSAAAAHQAGLAFLPLEEEVFKLALPLRLAAHPRVAEFLQFTLEQLASVSKTRPTGYRFDVLGKVETVGLAS